MSDCSKKQRSLYFGKNDLDNTPFVPYYCCSNGYMKHRNISRYFWSKKYTDTFISVITNMGRWELYSKFGRVTFCGNCSSHMINGSCQFGCLFFQKIVDNKICTIIFFVGICTSNLAGSSEQLHHHMKSSLLCCFFSLVSFLFSFILPNKFLLSGLRLFQFIFHDFQLSLDF